MSNEMIEPVARALWEFNSDPDAPPNGDFWKSYEPDALAAIAAEVL